jgi:hypothetical protein
VQRRAAKKRADRECDEDEGELEKREMGAGHQGESNREGMPTSGLQPLSALVHADNALHFPPTDGTFRTLRCAGATSNLVATGREEVIVGCIQAHLAQVRVGVLGTCSSARSTRRTGGRGGGVAATGAARASSTAVVGRAVGIQQLLTRG